MGVLDQIKKLLESKMLAILNRFIENKTGVIDVLANQQHEEFLNHIKFSNWAKEDMTKALKAESTKGISTNTLAPQKMATGAEAAVTIYRLIYKIIISD